MKYIPKAFKTNVNISETSLLKDFIVLLGGLFAVMAVLYVLLGFGVDLLVPRISLQAEKILARPFLQFYAEAEENMSSAQLQGMLSELLQVMPEENRDYRVSLVKKDIFNAMALPGGHIVIYSGLLDAVDSDEELAFVLAHELGHFVHRDHLKGLGRGLILFTFLSVVAGPDNFASDFIGESLVGVQMQFSQRQETQADLYALGLLNRRYGKVNGAIAFMKKIAAEEDAQVFVDFFSTHPQSESRIAALMDEVNKKGYSLSPR